eukprot:12983923-Heterocapsa_arctica.AAC.1
MDYSTRKSRKEDGGGQKEAAEDADVEVSRGECGSTMLIAKDEKEDRTFATVVPTEGPARPWTARRI